MSDNNNQQSQNAQPNQNEPQVPSPSQANQPPQYDLSNPMTFGEEPPMPNPQEANNPPQVDLSNPVQKGGTLPENK